MVVQQDNQMPGRPALRYWHVLLVAASVGGLFAGASVELFGVLGLSGHEVGVGHFLVPTAVGALFGAALLWALREREWERACRLEFARREAAMEALNAVLNRRMGACAVHLAATEEQLLRAQRLGAVEALATSLAHDLNNLLTALVASSSLVRQAKNDEARDTLLAGMEVAAKRAASLASGLTEAARWPEPRIERLDVGAVIAAFGVVLRRLLRDDVELVMTAARATAEVVADRGLLEQILLNLVTNSRDAMPRGGVITIEVDGAPASQAPRRAFGEREGDCVIVRVRDNGCGMSAEVLSRVFEPFYSTKPRGDGTGLGMSIVGRIVERLGGAIDVQSVVGAGTTVALWLPSAPSAEVAARPDDEGQLAADDLRAGEWAPIGSARRVRGQCA